MKIEFKNGSTIETIKSQTDTKNTNRRGIMSNFITTICFDTVENEYVIKTLDLREPINRYVPSNVINECNNKLNMKG